MGGTAEGAARARARRAAKLAGVALPPATVPAVVLAPDEQPHQNIISSRPTDGLMAADGTATSEVNQAVERLAGDAEVVARKILRGTLGASAQTRANVAVRVLEMVSDPKRRAAGAQSPGNVAGALAALGAALQRRQHAADAVDAVVVRAEPVAERAAPQSQQQPDK